MYFRFMIAQCQKCGKEYEPKRRGGKFCSTSCRVVQHQRSKQGDAWPIPPTGDEVYLADKLVAVGRSAQEALVKVEGLAAEIALAEVRQLLRAWTGNMNNSVIERIQRRDQQDRAARADQFKRTR